MSEQPLPGCCIDGACRPNIVGCDEDESDCMRLPYGVRCGDCTYVSRCVAMFGKSPTDDTCDWFPRKFSRRTI